MQQTITVKPIFKSDMRFTQEIRMDFTKPISEWHKSVETLYLYACTLNVPFLVYVNDDAISGSKWLRMIQKSAAIDMRNPMPRVLAYENIQ